MSKHIELAAASLENLAEEIVRGFSAENTMGDNWGWNFPPLTKHEFASIPQALAASLRNLQPNLVDADSDVKIAAVKHKIDWFIGNVLPHFWNGNGATAMPSFSILMDWIRTILTPFESWQSISDNKLLPAGQIKRLRSVQVELDQLIPQKDELSRQIDAILSATQAAESLPADLESLNEARKKVEKYSMESSTLHAKIEELSESAAKHEKLISGKNDVASRLVDQCEDAYRITTTKGLAAAFDQRGTRLSNSIVVWVVGLLVALIGGAYIGHLRFLELEKVLGSKQVSWGIICINLALSILSLAAPIWFAWLSTKQISQRFRLSEDYAFKASVAKAYEGYRKEAARLDSAFEARLFSSALTRLEEAPIRLMDADSFSSPWQELISSAQFRKAMDEVPELKDKFVDIVKTAVENVTSKPNKKSVNDDEKVLNQDSIE